MKLTQYEYIIGSPMQQNIQQFRKELYIGDSNILMREESHRIFIFEMIKLFK